MKAIDAILPHLGIARWTDADTELIIGDLAIAAQRGLRALSATPAAAAIAESMAPRSVKIFSFTPDVSKAGGENVQLWMPPEKSDGSDELPAGARPIFALPLANVDHLDWGAAIRKKSSGGGFLLIDDGTANMHRLYDFLNVSGDFDGELQYCGKTNDPQALEQARRLVEKVRPDLIGRFRIFVTAEFFRRAEDRIKFDFGEKSI